MIRLGILGSTQGTSLQPVLDAIASGRLKAEVAVVISHREEAGILARARAQHVPAVCVGGVNREAVEQQMHAILRAHAVDAVLLIGWMRILSPTFVTFWREKIFNVHPSLLPAFAGGMNADVHRAVLAAGCTETGCTVHRVTEVVDQGEILVQKKCPVLPEDSVETLKARVQALEGDALIETVQKLFESQ